MFTLRRALLAALVVSCLVSEARAQWLQWRVIDGGNDHFYRFTTAPSAWTSAEAEAIAMGGHLVSIESQGEQNFIQDNFLSGDFRFLPLWIGLSDQASPGTFLWTDGTPLGFTNWLSGEPNNMGGAESFVCINWHFACCFGPDNFGKWNDATDAGTGSFGGTSDGPYFGVVERATPPGCPEDLNGSGSVNTADLLLLLGAFGQNVAPGATGDINGDGAVNTSDLLLLLGRFGQFC